YVGFTRQRLEFFRRRGLTEFGFETYLYFIRSYVEVVLGKQKVECPEVFEDKPAGVSWESHTQNVMDLLETRYRLAIPEDPLEQLAAAIRAVQGKMRASAMAGGVLLQAMAYPHLDDQSGSGVLMTVDPRTGEAR